MIELILLFSILTLGFILLFIFYKRQSRKIILINYIVALFFGLIWPFNLSFSPKTAFYLHAFPLNLGDHYVSSFDLDGTSLIYYKDAVGTDEILIYQRFAGMYILTNPKIHQGFYWSSDSDPVQTLHVVFIEKDDGSFYGLIHHSQMVDLISLQISDTIIPLTWTEGDEYFVFTLDNGTYPLEIVRNGQNLIGLIER